MNDFPATRESLLLKIRNPDNAVAWEEFVNIYRPVVYRIATARGLQHADALDLVQTVFVSIAGAIPRWEKRSGSTKFRHWLKRVAKNATLNALTRKSPFQADGGSTAVCLLNEHPSPDAATQSMIDLEYRRELFLRAAEEVRADIQPDTWKAFELTAIDGMKNEQAAKELGKSIGTIHASRSRVMKRLSTAVARMEGSTNEH